MALHAAADTLFHLHDVELGFKLAEQIFHARGNAHGVENFLALIQLQLQMRGNGVHQAAVVVDAVNGADHFVRNFLVKLGKLVELRQQRAAQSFDVGAVAIGIVDGFNMRQK